MQFQHLQSMLSETDPQLADMVRKQFPVWGAQQISVQHSSRLPPKILLRVILFRFPLQRKRMTHHHQWQKMWQGCFYIKLKLEILFFFFFYCSVNNIFLLNNWQSDRICVLKLLLNHHHHLGFRQTVEKSLNDKKCVWHSSFNCLWFSPQLTNDPRLP